MRLWIVLCLFVLIIPVMAQEDTEEITEPVIYTAQIVVDSTFTYQLPTEESEWAASVFEGNVLEVIGRNADGLWFQVRRRFSDDSLGWIHRRFVSYSFSTTELPMTDLTTGVTGTEPVYDTGIAVQLIMQAALRDRPSPNGERIGTVPLNVTIPIIERSPDNLWFRINHLGTVGWISEITTRTADDTAQAPIAPGFETLSVPVEIIPPEVQLAQVQRLRDYIAPLADQADQVAGYWETMQNNIVVPCEPPAPGDYTDYPISQRDIVELPELLRLGRQSRYVTRDINATLIAMNRCGLYTPLEISTAFAQAVNARAIAQNILVNLDRLEPLILTGEAR